MHTSLLFSPPRLRWMPSQPPPPCRRPQVAQVESKPRRRRRTTASPLSRFLIKASLDSHWILVFVAVVTFSAVSVVYFNQSLKPKKMNQRELRDLKEVKEEVAKYKIDENVQRETINHRSLRHPNIVRFKEDLLTPSHLAIVMEYAAGGELFERIYSAGRFSEAEVLIFLPAADMWSQPLSVHAQDKSVLIAAFHWYTPS